MVFSMISKCLVISKPLYWILDPMIFSELWFIWTLTSNLSFHASIEHLAISILHHYKKFEVISRWYKKLIKSHSKDIGLSKCWDEGPLKWNTSSKGGKVLIKVIFCWISISDLGCLLIEVIFHRMVVFLFLWNSSSFRNNNIMIDIITWQSLEVIVHVVF